MTTHEGGYGQYCPIARAAEVLGERWTMLIIRDMLCGFTRFNDLARGNPGLSRPLLSKRLRQLQRAGVVQQVDQQYVLTPAGEELRPIVFGIGEWGAKWQFDEPREDELDPELLMWWAHERLTITDLPGERLVLEFRFRGEPRRFWIVADTRGPSVCTSDPGFETDVLIDADLAALYQVWLGRIDLRHALRNGTVTLSGTRDIVRTMPDILQLSPVAPLVRSAR